MVMIAELLNKANNNGTYRIVFFNTETRTIIASLPTNGTVGEFGLCVFLEGLVYKRLKAL